MTKTYDDPIVQGNSELSYAKQALADAYTQQARAQARVRFCQVNVSHEEQNAGLAEDRVLIGEREDKRDAAKSQQARAALNCAKKFDAGGVQ